jgi:hypothetical protein
MGNISQTYSQKPAQIILTVGVVREIGDVPAGFRCYIATRRQLKFEVIAKSKPRVD